MQHIPVVSHALWKRDSCFENVGRGPCYTNNWLIPLTGLVFIYSGRRASQGRGVERSGGERGVVERLGLPIDFNEEEGYFQRALEWHLLTNRESCARLC